MARLVFLSLLILCALGATAAPRKTVTAPAMKAAPAKRPARKPAKKAAKVPVKVPARTPAPPAKVAAYSVSAPVDVPWLQAQRGATASYIRPEAGELEALFDGNPHTLFRAEPPAGTAAFWQVLLHRPRALQAVSVLLPQGGFWSLAAADSEADLKARRGSFRSLVSARRAEPGQPDRVGLDATRGYRVVRLECRPLSGAAVELAEWSLRTSQDLVRIDVDSFAPSVARGGLLQLRADGVLDAGARPNLTPEVAWEVWPPERGQVDSLGRLEGAEPGKALVTARVGGLRSTALEVQVLPEGVPDWDVTHIERFPRRSAGEPGRRRSEEVTWIAHVKNYGTGPAPQVPAEWRVDGKRVRSGRLPKLERFAPTELVFTAKLDNRPHVVELVVDPKNEIAETSEQNNSLPVHSDGLSVGFWVEESTLRYFHRHQQELGVGSNSWEDWAQRQVSFWNRAEEEAGLPGPRRRWRLDRIVVVADGKLPLAGGSPDREPDRRDQSVDLMLGFRAYDPGRDGRYSRTRDPSPDNPFFLQRALLRELETVRPGGAVALGREQRR